MAEQLPHGQEDSMSILLRYQGPSVEDGSMDVYAAAANMIAFSDYVVAATHKVYGEQAQVRAEVNAFQRGSFSTDLSFQVATLGAAFFGNSPDLAGVLTAVKQSLELFTFLKGKEPSKVEHRDDRSVNVTSNNGAVIVVNLESLQLTLDEGAAKAAGRFVAEALSKSGIEQIEISSAGKKLTEVTKANAVYFGPVEGQEMPVTEQELQMGLVIEQPSFKDGTSTKWTLWDGENSMQFVMEDEAFIARVDAGERFGKGDILVCDVRITQTKQNSKLKIKRVILKVIDHKVGEEQTHMGF